MNICQMLIEGSNPTPKGIFADVLGKAFLIRNEESSHLRILLSDGVFYGPIDFKATNRIQHLIIIQTSDQQA